jgi:hypothetical protein
VYQNKISGSENVCQVFEACSALLGVTQDVKLEDEVKEIMPAVKCIKATH